MGIEKRKDVAVWFEIPAADLDRATRFYETILATMLTKVEAGPEKLAIFNPEEGIPGRGCVKEDPKAAGGKKGTLVYLNADGILNDAAGRVEKAGGKLLSPVVKLPKDMGSFIHIEDTEGNRVGLHTVE